MDHQDVLEQLELAAVEPGGLDRLMAGDTASAAAVAGHLAGCERCTGELERLRRAVPLLRDVVRTTPPADLRERTLAYVTEHGVVRGSGAGVAAAPRSGSPVVPPPPGPAREPSSGAGVIAIDERRRSSPLPWIAAIAAAVVLSVAASTTFMNAQLDARLAEQARAIGGLEAVTTATLTLTAQPDVRRVALASVDGTSTSGSLLFSPRTTELVVVAEGLTPPPAGQEYRCWVQDDAGRQVVGRMYFAGALAYWVGDTPGVGALTPGATFGVSLADVGGSGADAEPVLTGRS